MVESSTPDAGTAVLTVTVDAEPDDVFAAFTEPGRLATWYWPASFATLYETDPRPGGRFAFRSTGLPAGNNVAVRGIYGEIRRPELLTFLWAWDGDMSPFTQVAVQIRPHEGGSEVVVTHSENATELQRDDHLKGWHDCLARLADHLAVG
ncbi:SRPBCC domain-containing protein [Haloactinopolyspora sp.]|uniref:SRPBCC family protein n=1 Tax=Haloactinopolyspora sp. TaxID=1966353 RepID=UPI00263509A9|nr:SRPBCC domain-containing protein [Haloactinopolyspora sp.]